VMFEVQTKVPDAHESEIWCVSWRKNRIATGSLDGKVKVWNNDLDLIQQFDGSPLGVVSVATNGEDVACSSIDGKIKIWNITSGILKSNINVGCGNNWHIRWQPNSSIIAVSTQNSSILFYDVNTGELTNTLQQTVSEKSVPSFGLSLTFSSDASYVATGNKDGKITLYNLGTGESKLIEAHISPVRSLAFSSDSKTLFTCSDDKTINIFDVSSNNKLGSLYGHFSWIFGLSASSNGNHIASCSSDKTVKIWSINDKQCLLTLHQHTGKVLGVDWSDFGDYLVSVGEDKSIIIYKCISG